MVAGTRGGRPGSAVMSMPGTSGIAPCFARQLASTASIITCGVSPGPLPGIIVMLGNAAISASMNDPWASPGAMPGAIFARMTSIMRRCMAGVAPGIIMGIISAIIFIMILLIAPWSPFIQGASRRGSTSGYGRSNLRT